MITTKSTETFHFYGTKPETATLEKRQYVAVTFENNDNPTVFISNQLVEAAQLDETIEMLGQAKQLIQRRNDNDNAS